MKKILLSIAVVGSLAITGCKKDYLDTRPSNGVQRSQILSKLNSVYAALNGSVDAQFAFGVGGSTRHDNFGQKAWDLSSDLMGNDMIVHTQGYGWFNSSYNYTEFITAAAGRQPQNAWNYYYDLIKGSLLILSNVDNIVDASQEQKDIIKGQCLGLRAYAYYNLINLFQQTYKGNETAPGIPLQVDIKELSDKGRGTVQQAYDLIISDLTAAENLLNGKPRVNKTYIDVSVIRGFRARVALIQEDWATAAAKAVAARAGYTLIPAASYALPSTFSDVTTGEWMWGSDIPAEKSSIYASFFSHIDIRTGGYAALGGQKKITKALYDQIPDTDVRKSVFNGSAGSTSNPQYNQLKHQVPVAGSWAADYLYMRAAEMYLIEAEAQARLGNDAAARTALNALVSTRNPAYNISTLSGAALLNEIKLQRRIELWGEGFSLIDIKRWKEGLNRPTGAGNHGAPNFNPNVYTTGPNDSRFIMRIPQSEIDNNTKIGPEDQNP